MTLGNTLELRLAPRGLLQGEAIHGQHMPDTLHVHTWRRGVVGGPRLQSRHVSVVCCEWCAVRLLPPSYHELNSCRPGMFVQTSSLALSRVTDDGAASAEPGSWHYTPDFQIATKGSRAGQLEVQVKTFEKGQGQ